MLQRSSVVLATALALFAMLFGSGNIAFPLGLGRNLGNMAVYAMIGFFVTAALVPVLGVLAMALCQGNYRTFMEPIGRIPARLVIFICFALIGPFAVIPRCVVFAHQALQWLIPQLSLFVFSLLAAGILLLTTIRKSSVVALMGKVLGPLKLALLTAVIIKGFFVPAQVLGCTLPAWPTFLQGIYSGYGTLDLLGVIFASGLLVASIAVDQSGHKRQRREMMLILVQAGILAACLLGILYAGFVLVASFQSGAAACAGVEEGQLLSVLAAILLGSGGGVLASITMALACSTTAIGLTAIFAEYISTEIPHQWLRYQYAVMATVVIATFFANFGADGIKSFLAPIVSILYPALIVLAITHVLVKAWNVRVGAWPFYITIIIALLMRFSA